MTLRHPLLILLLALPAAAVPAAGADAPAPRSHAEAALANIVAREKALWALKALPESDEGVLRGQFQQVLADYRRLVADQPAFVPGLVACGLFLRKVDCNEEAAGLFRRADDLDPGLAVVKNQIGNHLAETGNPVEALAWFAKAAELEPGEPLYHYQTGVLLHEAQEDFLASGGFTREELDARMLDAFGRAAALRPGDTPFAYRHAEAYYDLATPRWEEALAAWQAIEAAVPPGRGRQTVLLHEARVLILLGRHAGAAALLKEVDDPALAENRKTLIDQLPPASEN